jgi:hypothetical protein
MSEANKCSIKDRADYLDIVKEVMEREGGKQSITRRGFIPPRRSRNLKTDKVARDEYNRAKSREILESRKEKKTTKKLVKKKPKTKIRIRKRVKPKPTKFCSICNKGLDRANQSGLCQKHFLQSTKGKKRKSYKTRPTMFHIWGGVEINLHKEADKVGKDKRFFHTIRQDLKDEFIKRSSSPSEGYKMYQDDVSRRKQELLELLSIINEKQLQKELDGRLIQAGLYTHAGCTANIFLRLKKDNGKYCLVSWYYKMEQIMNIVKELLCEKEIIKKQ